MASDRRMRAIRLYTMVKTDPVTAKRLGAFEKTRGLPTGTVRHPSGRKMRKDKKIGSVRKQYGDWPF